MAKTPRKILFSIVSTSARENQIAIAEEILPYFRNRQPQPARAAAE